MTKPLRVGFCVSGNGHLARAAILHRERLGIQPTIVVGEKSTSTELADFCQRFDMPFVRIESGNRKEFDDEITRVCVDANLGLMTTTFNKILPSKLVRHYSHRIVNFHPALLPAFKGFHGFKESTSSDCRYLGATLQELIEAVDEGPIIAQTILGIRWGESPESLGRRIFNPLRLMYLQVISWYAQDRIEYDSRGHIHVRDAIYGEFPTSPSVEVSFPD